MEMKAKATDNVTSVKLNVIKLFTCTQVLVLEIRNNVIEIGIRVLKQIHRRSTIELPGYRTVHQKHRSMLHPNEVKVYRVIGIQCAEM